MVMAIHASSILRQVFNVSIPVNIPVNISLNQDTQDVEDLRGRLWFELEGNM